MCEHNVICTDNLNLARAALRAPDTETWTRPGHGFGCNTTLTIMNLSVQNDSVLLAELRAWNNPSCGRNKTEEVDVWCLAPVWPQCCGCPE